MNQIEELIKIITDRCEAELGQVHASSRGGKVIKTVDISLIAKDIFNADFRKISKNSCVICHKDISTELPKIDIYGNRYCSKHYLCKCQQEMEEHNDGTT